MIWTTLAISTTLSLFWSHTRNRRIAKKSDRVTRSCKKKETILPSLQLDADLNLDLLELSLKIIEQINILQEKPETAMHA